MINNDITYIYSIDGKKLAEVNLYNKTIVIDEKNQTQETLPQSYAIHFIVNNIDSEIMQRALLLFIDLSNLSKLIAQQVIAQYGESKGYENEIISNINTID